MAEHLLPGSSSVASGLSQWLSQQGGSAQASPRVLSHAAWYLAANGAGQQAAMDQVGQSVGGGGEVWVWVFQHLKDIFGLIEVSL